MIHPFLCSPASENHCWLFNEYQRRAAFPSGCSGDHVCHRGSNFKLAIDLFIAIRRNSDDAISISRQKLFSGFGIITIETLSMHYFPTRDKTVSDKFWFSRISCTPIFGCLRRKNLAKPSSANITNFRGWVCGRRLPWPEPFAWKRSMKDKLASNCQLTRNFDSFVVFSIS